MHFWFLHIKNQQKNCRARQIAQNHHFQLYLMYRVVCTGLGHPCAGHRCGSYTAGHGLVQDKVQDYLVEKTHVRCRAVCSLCAQPSCRTATCVPSSEPSSVQTSVCAPQEQRTYIRIAPLLYLHMGQINQDAYCSKKWSYFSQL